MTEPGQDERGRPRQFRRDSLDDEALDRGRVLTTATTVGAVTLA